MIETGIVIFIGVLIVLATLFFPPDDGPDGHA